MRSLIVMLLAASLPLSAQFWARLANPSVEVGILHPPELGLKVSRVALAPSRSSASMEMASALSADLLDQRDLEVVAKGDVDLLDRAVYNLGIVAFAQGDPAAAIPKFRRALEILPDASIFKDALKDAQRAVEVRAAYERYQQSADLTAHAAIRPQPSNGKTRTPEERLEDLERLWKKGLLSEDEYRAKRAEILKLL